MKKVNISKSKRYFLPRKFLEHNYETKLKLAEKKLNSLIKNNEPKEVISKQEMIITSLENSRPVIVLSQMGGNVLVVPLTSRKAKQGFEETHYKINEFSKNEYSYAKISMPITLNIEDFLKYKKEEKSEQSPRLKYETSLKIKERVLKLIDCNNKFDIKLLQLTNDHKSINDTIYSLVTKPINQNVGIIRLSGPKAFEAIKEFTKNFVPSQNKVEYAKLYINDNFVDESLILSFIAPNSFTGENVIEIQTHGSLFVLNKILSKLNTLGLKQSEPGEFMKQAYINGKIDLSQSEAINTLILSENKKLSDLSSQVIDGKQSNYINESLDKLGAIVSRIQVSIDYPENTDLPEYNLKNIGETIEELKIDLDNIIVDSQRLINYSKGIKIALVGQPNAGKSTLLNTLLKEDRAIVSNIEGTTRDVIESTIYIDDLKTTLQDTAGIRAITDDPIEKEGINRSIKTIDESDITILLIDGTKDINEQRKFFNEITTKYSNKIIEVVTKSDLVKNEGINISSADDSYNLLLDQIKLFVRDNIFDEEKDTHSLLVTQNQIDNFTEVKQSLVNALAFINVEETPDVVAFELENSMKLLGKIIGVEIDQDYLTNLFASFCIGK